MTWKIIFCILLVLDFAYKLLKLHLSNKQKDKPLPKNVRDVYDAKRYKQWIEYSAERKRLQLVGSAVRLVFMLALFSTNALSWLYGVLPGGEFVKSILLLAAFLLTFTLIGIPFQYISQFKIEEKYGFNRTSMFTFVKDRILGFVLEYLLDLAIFSVIFGGYCWLGNYFFLPAFAGLAVILLCINTFSPYVNRLYNKMTPLAEGGLRSKLQRLFAKSGYKLGNIYVMDASKRSTEVNAYCAGMGKTKEIVLYDTLVDNYTEGQVVAVFSHELGHYKHRDTTKLLIYSLVNILFILAAIAAFVLLPQISMSYGFEGESLIFGILAVLMTDVFGLVSTLLMAPMAFGSRSCERRADAFAATNGYGKELISALKKLAYDDMCDLNPHPFVVAMEYTHPPMHERIELIEKRLKKKKH